MTWKIHSWSPDDGVGAIASPHFGPLPFHATANVDSVRDFRVGEAVWVELDGQPGRVRFEEVISIVGLDDDIVFAAALFRLASPEEVEANHLEMSGGTKAFCIVTDHGQGADGPSIFVVARSVEVIAPEVLVPPRT